MILEIIFMEVYGGFGVCLDTAADLTVVRRTGLLATMECCRDPRVIIGNTTRGVWCIGSRTWLPGPRESGALYWLKQSDI